MVLKNITITIKSTGVKYNIVGESSCLVRNMLQHFHLHFLISDIHEMPVTTKS